MTCNSNHISYQMRMIEGKEARVKRIIIKGNTKTNEHVIRREIRTKPGDLFNRNDIIRTQRELSQLGYFNDQAFQINPMPNPQMEQLILNMLLKRSHQIKSNYRGGMVQPKCSGIIGTLGLTFNNFSLQNTFNKYAWSPLPAGDGQRLSIRAQTTGRFYQGYNFSFTEPWLGGKKPNSLSFWVNHTSLAANRFVTKKSDPGYAGVGISGVGVGLGRRKKIPDDYFNAYYELSYQYYDVINYPQLFS
jgi:outer membrane protein insertion porin family